MPVIACPDCGRDVSTLAPVCPHCGRPSPAGTTPLAASAAPQAREETLWRGTPSPILLIGKVAVLVLVLVVIPLVAHFFASTMIDPLSASNIRMAGWLITAVIVAVQLVLVIVAWLKLRSTMYVVTTQRVMIEQGILSKTVNEIDLRYVDDSQFFQGLTDRILGIGNVTLISTDKNTPTYVLRSVRDPRAVREMIRSHAYQVSHRQIFTRAT